MKTRKIKLRNSASVADISNNFKISKKRKGTTMKKPIKKRKRRSSLENMDHSSQFNLQITSPNRDMDITQTSRQKNIQRLDSTLGFSTRIEEINNLTNPITSRQSLNSLQR